MEKLPRFKNEDEEINFWTRNSPLDLLATMKLRLTVLPKLKPSRRTITIRLPESLLESIKVLANKKDVTYQSMLKILLAEAVRKEILSSSRRATAG